MKNLVRGGAILSLLSFCVVFFYAQATTESTLAIANDSQATIQNNITALNLVNNLKTNELNKPAVAPTPVKDKEKVNIAKEDADKVNETKKLDDNNTVEENKLVKKTSMVSAKAAGVSRGSFSATAYCLSGRTAMGHGVRRGLIAADPRVLKLGSTITISAGPYSGTYLVSDTGGSIKGKELDIWMPSCKEARRFGRRSVQVFTSQ